MSKEQQLNVDTSLTQTFVSTVGEIAAGRAMLLALTSGLTERSGNGAGFARDVARRVERFDYDLSVEESVSRFEQIGNLLSPKSPSDFSNKVSVAVHKASAVYRAGSGRLN